ncbi:PWI domain-containing protein [Gongronella butleri]|nr:PWI domain-containing protein [Gongronella butleri]
MLVNWAQKSPYFLRRRCLLCFFPCSLSSFCTMGDGFFKGASADQDSRFSNKEKKLLKTLKFPPEFDQKVDIKKVNLDVIRPWMAHKITDLLGVEDDVVIDLAFNLLEDAKPDPRRIQINLTGFLETKTPEFMLALWKLLLSAQESPSGIPAEFIAQKKEELRRKKDQEDARRQEQHATMDTIRRKRDEDRDDHARERDADRPRRSRFDRSSPPPPRRHRSPSPSRRRRRSPTPERRRRRRSRSRSRSPPAYHRRRSRSRSPRRDDRRDERRR